MDDFECIRCGFCCHLDVKLTENDIQRLKAAGKKDFSKQTDHGIFLKHIGNHCIFLDPKKKMCKVYDSRPDICRRFPVHSDGEMSGKCQQDRRFGSRISRKIIGFIAMERENQLKPK